MTDGVDSPSLAVTGDGADTAMASNLIGESAQFGDTTIPERVIAPAMRTVAADAKNPEDARQLLEMLGLIEPTVVEKHVPCQRHCAKCRRPARNQGENAALWPGTVQITARDMCGTCYRAEVDAERGMRHAS